MIPEPTAPAERVERELERVLARVRALGPDRLERAAPPHPAADEPEPPTGPAASPAARVRGVLTRLADATADLQGRRRRAVPVLGARALGDQLAVLVADHRAALAEPSPGPGSAAGAASGAVDVPAQTAVDPVVGLLDLADLLTDLRRSL